MLTYGLTVFQKAAEIFLMIAAGFMCGKSKFVSDIGAKEMTSVLFYIVSPCLIISSMQDTIGKITVQNMAVAFFLALLSMGLCIAGSMVLYRKPDKKRSLLRFCCVYSNCGFIGLPLAQAVLGSVGATYAAIFIAAFNLLCWTHGYALMSGETISQWKRAILNPGIIGLAIGLPLFLFSVHIPETVLSPMKSISGMNTPLAMVVIGFYISKVHLPDLFRSLELYRLSLIRLIVLPLVCFAVMLPMHADRTVFATVLILISAPVGANSVMFSAQFGEDVELASKAVALSTIFSLLTMPFFPVLVDLFAH